MDTKRRQRLESKGWQFGGVRDFLGLSDDEAEYVRLRVSLSRAFRMLRTALNLTQEAAAKQIGSSQSRVAKLEGADPSVSLDLYFRSFYSLGVKTRDLASILSEAATQYEVNAGKVHAHGLEAVIKATAEDLVPVSAP